MVLIMFGKVKHITRFGYGFIRARQTGDQPVQDVFLHRSEFHGDWDTLQKDDTVEYTPGLKDGRPQAFDVRLLEIGGAE